MANQKYHSSSTQDKHRRCLKATRCTKINLFKLPLELQDIIFQLAYTRHDDLSIFSPVEWKARELRSISPQPFPGPKIKDFLVPKHFFIAAAKAYIGNQTITSTGSNAFDGIIGAYTKDLVMTNTNAFHLDIMPEAFPMLTKLKLLVHPVSLSACPKDACEDLYEERDFVETQIYKCVKEIRDLRSFETVSRIEVDELRLSKEQEMVWKANLAKYEGLSERLLRSQ